MPTQPVVFISYSHDPEPHKQRVLDLSERLRKDGIETILDRYVNGTPPEKWPRWMLNGLERASHVLCVCTSTYYRRFRGHEVPGVGKGVDWEGAIITQELYDARSSSTKFVPVVFAPGDEAHVPEPLRGGNCYCLDTHYEALYDAILGQAGFEPGPLGALRLKPRPTAAAARTDVVLIDRAAQGASLESAPVEPTEEEIGAVFDDLVRDIDELLDSTPNVARFLGSAAKPLLIQAGGKWKVAPAFRRGGADVGPALGNVAARISTFTGPRHEWDAIEQILGGAFVLGIKPLWVWEQRMHFSKRPVEHAKFAEVVPFARGERAQFLAILAAALAKGCARLERVFGALDARQAPDLPDTMPGITKQDRSAEIQRHFIRFVLGPSEEYDVDALEGEELATFFRRIGEMLTVAMKIDRDPFVAAGARFKQLAVEVKAHLELTDLVLFVPGDSGSEADHMSDPVIALTYLSRIHKIIVKRRPNL